VYYTVADSVPGDLFAYGREAMFCFIERRYIASITMAFATVELILNKDSRMRSGPLGWRSVNAKLARSAEAKGLPSDVSWNRRNRSKRIPQCGLSDYEIS
jgi:hypothetical protein